MARSRKKAIHKDKGWQKRDYWKTVRRVHKQQIREAKSYLLYEGWNCTFTLKNPKSIINDYDYCDYISNMEIITEGELNTYTFINKEYIEKFRRK
jgi:hypothetical protein